MKRIAVLISGGGSNLQAIIDGIEAGEIQAEIGVVLSNRKAAHGLERAKKHNIPTEYICKLHYDDNDIFNDAIIEKLAAYKIDFVVLAGYLSILSKKFVQAYPNRIINIHPSLIPAFCGMGYYGLKVHEAALEYGVKVTGATVHFVDEEADTGAIILQDTVQVQQEDDSETLQQRVLKIEHALLPKAVKLMAENKLQIVGRRVLIKE